MHFYFVDHFVFPVISAYGRAQSPGRVLLVIEIFSLLKLVERLRLVAHGLVDGKHSLGLAVFSVGGRRGKRQLAVQCHQVIRHIAVRA